MFVERGLAHQRHRLIRWKIMAVVLKYDHPQGSDQTIS
jgi:hypothetical protein